MLNKDGSWFFEGRGREGRILCIGVDGANAKVGTGSSLCASSCRAAGACTEVVCSNLEGITLVGVDVDIAIDGRD